MSEIPGEGVVRLAQDPQRVGRIGMAPVLTLDGPTASGKGTIAARVAERLGWHYLDSGALYRLTALQVERAGGRLLNPIAFDDEEAIARTASDMHPVFSSGHIYLEGRDVSDAIRQEHIGELASRIAVYAPLRQALLTLQRGFRRPPGLVADGRDMGTVVFPDAPLKVYLTASVEARAERRHRQLLEKGFSASLDPLLQALRERDRRDTTRAVAPLVAAKGAVVIDSTSLNVDQTVDQVLAAWLPIAGARTSPST